jgi:hypothetical protein
MEWNVFWTRAPYQDDNEGAEADDLQCSDQPLLMMWAIDTTCSAVNAASACAAAHRTAIASAIVRAASDPRLLPSQAGTCSATRTPTHARCGRGIPTTQAVACGLNPELLDDNMQDFGDARQCALLPRQAA